MAETGNGSLKFDIASIAMTRSDDGTAMTVLHPVTRQPIMQANGQPMSITLAGRFSDANRTVLREIQVARVEMVNERRTITEEHITNENIKQLAACTLAWNIDQLDGQDFPCTQANIRRFWQDKRFLYLHERALAFIGEDRNFLAGSSGIWSDTPATFSVSPSPSPTVAAA